jgi:carbon monoxide dehydrogenase subunit G
MPAVTRSTTLAAAPAEVFAYLDEPANQATVTPGIDEAERIERLANGGNRARYVYRMLGVDLDGEVRATEYVPDERITYAVTGAVEGTIDWRFEPAGADGGAFEGDPGEAPATRFTYAADYELPGAVLAAAAAPAARWYNRRQVDRTLSNLEERFGAVGD